KGELGGGEKGLFRPNKRSCPRQTMTLYLGLKPPCRFERNSPSSLLKWFTSPYRPAWPDKNPCGDGPGTLRTGLLGRSQAVRQRILIPPFGGSIPPAPARYCPSKSGTFRLSGFFILNAVSSRILNACC